MTSGPTSNTSDAENSPRLSQITPAADSDLSEGATRHMSCGRSNHGALGNSDPRTGEYNEAVEGTRDRQSLGFCCRPPSHVQSAQSLRTGQSLPCGIGPSSFITQGSYYESYRKSFWRFWTRRPEKPAMLILVSPTIMSILPSEVQNKTNIHHELTIDLSSKDVKRWQLASTAYKDETRGLIENKDNYSRVIRSAKPEHIKGWDPGNKCLSHRSQNYMNMGDGPKGFEWQVYGGFVFSKSMYSGAHLALWSYGFATPSEALLWRISCCALAALPCLIIIIVSLSVIEHRARKAWSTAHGHLWLVSRVFYGATSWLGVIGNMLKNRTSARSAIGLIIEDWPSVGLIPLVPILYLVAVLDIFARIFIVIESFLSLRHVPIGVHTGVGWAQYTTSMIYDASI